MKAIHVFTIFTTPSTFFDGLFGYMAEQGIDTVLVCSPDERAEGFARRNNIRYVPVVIPRSLNPVAIIKAICGLVTLIKVERPDAVFGHTPVGALTAMVAARLASVSKRVYYRHGLIYTTFKGLRRMVFKAEERFVSCLATEIINVSHSLARVAVADKLNPEEKQCVIGSGSMGLDAVGLFNPELIEPEKLDELRRSFGSRGDELVFSFAGRMCADKGVRELVTGFRLFCERNAGARARLLLIGDVDSRDAIGRDIIDIINSDPAITLTGFVSRQEMPYYYAASDVFVFPSHREGFGLCVIEASAMQLPALVSRVHGCEDSIEEHVTGEYIALSAESICRGMELMMDVNVRKSLGLNGRRQVLERYDYSVLRPLMVAKYKQIIES